MTDYLTGPPIGSAGSHVVPPDDVATVLELDRRRHDPDAAVRRRVAHDLAALARRQPTLALSTAQRWLAEGGPHTTSIVRRGLRPLVDDRDDTALRLAGYSPAAAVRVVDLVVDDDPPLAFGARLRFGARVVSSETRAAPVMVEYRIEHRNERGEPQADGGRLLTRVLDPLTDFAVRRAHRLPRRPNASWVAGPARLVLRVNGRDDAATTFTLPEPPG
jgi:hypothetical protein